ncbi:MAG: hypothetical protein EOO04_24005 [Chitinophagaceae bacterium]|nr:MAG: hypothetical protein EOO04_24005 [Chitinophagaceae bacterium]
MENPIISVVGNPTEPDFTFVNPQGVTIEIFDEDESLFISYQSPEGVLLEIAIEDDGVNLGEIEPNDFYSYLLQFGDLYVNHHILGLADEDCYSEEELISNPLILCSNFTQDFVIECMCGEHWQLVPTGMFRSTQDIISFFKDDDE